MKKRIKINRQALLSEEDKRFAYVKDRVTKSIVREVYIQREIVFVPTSFEEDPIDHEVIEVLQHHQRRLDSLTHAIRSNAVPRIRVRDGDPPCVVCGRWSDDWICPSCRRKYPWMRP